GFGVVLMSGTREKKSWGLPEGLWPAWEGLVFCHRAIPSLFMGDDKKGPAGSRRTCCFVPAWSHPRTARVYPGMGLKKKSGPRWSATQTIVRVARQVGKLLKCRQKR